MPKARKKTSPALKQKEPKSIDNTKAKKTRLIKKTAIRTKKSEPPPHAELYSHIEHRAYQLHVWRGFRHGYDFDDWLEAEREILSRKPPV